MRKAEVINAVISETGLKRAKATEVVECVFNTIGDSLAKGESVYIRGFATFKVRIAKSKIARNIGAGSNVWIPERKVAKLILCKQLKAQMNK